MRRRPPSRPCWSVGIISEPISANGNLSAILSLSLCDPFPTSGGNEGEGKRDAGKKSGRRAHRCSKENGCFGVFFLFFFPTIVVGVFDYFRGLEMIPCFGYLGIGNSDGFDYRRHFFSDTSRSFSRNNREI